MGGKVSSSAELLNLDVTPLSNNDALYSPQTDKLVLRQPGRYYFVLLDDLDSPKKWIKILSVNMRGISVKESKIENFGLLSMEDDGVLKKINKVLGYN